MRKRHVPTEQISLFLGHVPDGSAATTSIYAPYEPDFLADAIQAIESVMAEIRTHLKRAQIDRPDIDPAELAEADRTPHRRGVGETKREEVRFLILAGVPHAEVVRRTGVSSGTVSTIRQELKAKMPLYRNTESTLACPLRAQTPMRRGMRFRKSLESLVGPAGLEPATTPL
jgi:DNA-binding NarL/FixJ family response regulator